MVDTKIARGRPKKLDAELAATQAMELFWEKGYDAVGIAELTQALGVKPPSLYATFGNKAGLFGAAVDRYNELVGPCFAPAFAKTERTAFVEELLSIAARQYSNGASLRGCLVLDGTRNARDKDAITIASEHRENFLAQLTKKFTDLGCLQPDISAAATLSAMIGLSGSARHGMDTDKLRAIATKFAVGI